MGQLDADWSARLTGRIDSETWRISGMRQRSDGALISELIKWSSQCHSAVGEGLTRGDIRKTVTRASVHSYFRIQLVNSLSAFIHLSLIIYSSYSEHIISVYPQWTTWTLTATRPVTCRDECSTTPTILPPWRHRYRHRLSSACILITCQRRDHRRHRWRFARGEIVVTMGRSWNSWIEFSTPSELKRKSSMSCRCDPSWP